MSNWKTAWALCWPALAVAAPLYAERVALVIGNGAYRGGEIAELANPGNDARAVAGKLRGLGFAVVQGLDLDEDAFWAKVEEFAARTKGAEAALLFYAGHGVQVDGENYLIPVDAGSLESKADLRRATLKLDDVLEMMGGEKNLVFLDACRNNPLGRGLRSRGNGQGMAAVSVESLGREFLIAYAAAKGQTAADGEGGNSPYTQALLKHLGTPGVSVDDMLTKVTREVAALTGRKQIPWKNSSLEELFYFAPGAVGPITDPVGGGRIGRSGWGRGMRRGVVEVELGSGEGFEGQGDGEGVHHRSRELSRRRRTGGCGEESVGRAGKGAQSGRRGGACGSGEESGRRGGGEGAGGVETSGGQTGADCAECPQMVVIPAGSFEMGSPESEEGRYANEGPAHRVEIGEPLAVGVYEVTRDEYGAFVSETGHAGGTSCWVFTGSEWKEREGAGWRNPGYSQTGREPVVCVNWEDAQAYVGWLSGKTGEWYRLLSEAEWEYAARGGSGTRYWWGDEIGSGRANCEGCGSRWDDKQTAPVGSFRANGYGLYDVHGNVWEWMQDCWNDNYGGAPTDGKVWKSGDCSHRVLRGGSWDFNPRCLRSAYRSGGVTVSASATSAFVLPGRSGRESLPLYLVRAEWR